MMRPIALSLALLTLPVVALGHSDAARNAAVGAHSNRAEHHSRCVAGGA